MWENICILSRLVEPQSNAYRHKEISVSSKNIYIYIRLIFFFFSCEKCGKRFTKSHHLKAHLNTHEKNKPIKYIPPDSVSTLITPERAYQDVMTLLTASKIVTCDVDESTDNFLEENMHITDDCEFEGQQKHVKEEFFT